MATFDTDADVAVAVAHQRLHARAVTVRADWRRVLSIGRNALTRPAIIGGVALLGAIAGARARSPVECKCTGASPSLLRSLLVAVVTPLLTQAVSDAFKQAVSDDDVPPDPVMTSAAMPPPGTASSS